jgi:predicted molibdopterin-dependent oxidoreductase YjgC
MVVRTATERLREYRKMIVELLFAERNHICSVCVANGHCELQDLAAAVGVDHVRYDYQHPALKVDVTHERFGIDHNVASSARAVCASATRWRGRTPGTWRGAARAAASSRT